ncbi:hypothetical protein [Sorangium sp. So ce117]|uniref:hypothetical protein n=1 Tax=Sorangium sp. So ce117 TaxID=3133277 RepID=UPI003F62B3B2
MNVVVNVVVVVNGSIVDVNVLPKPWSTNESCDFRVTFTFSIEPLTTTTTTAFTTTFTTTTTRTLVTDGGGGGVYGCDPLRGGWRRVVLNFEQWAPERLDARPDA